MLFNYKIIKEKTGYDVEACWRVVVAEVNAGNKINLKIRLGNCIDDIAKLTKNTDELMAANEIAAAVVHNTAKNEFVNLKNYIENALKTV